MNPRKLSFSPIGDLMKVGNKVFEAVHRVGFPRDLTTRSDTLRQEGKEGLWRWQPTPCLPKKTRKWSVSALLLLACSLSLLSSRGGLAQTQSAPPEPSVILHSFGTDDGMVPGGLLQGSDGAFYGTDYVGGAFDEGVIYRVNPDGSGYTILHNFPPQQAPDHSFTPGGSRPVGSLVQGTDGYLYGVTQLGGTNDSGVVYKIRPDGSSYQVIYTFGSNSGGGQPNGGLTWGKDGMLYGATHDGTGEVFRLNPDGTGFQIVHAFSGPDGFNLNSPPIEGADGILYGVTYYGGANNKGVVFKVNPDGSGFQVLHSFGSVTDQNGNALDGAYPRGTLIQGSDGALYGGTQSGGTYGGGTLFRLTTDGSTFQVLQSFSGSGNVGTGPAGVVQGPDGALYGTVQPGTGSGWVYRINLDGSNYQVLYVFPYPSNPIGNISAVYYGFAPGPLIFGKDGLIYGTANGGPNSIPIDGLGGVIYRMRPDGSDFQVIHQCMSNDGLMGQYATGLYGVGALSLCQGSDGRLYGTTYAGGAGGEGAIFSVNPDGSDFTLIHSFNPIALSNAYEYNSDGALPHGVLIQGRDGALYGTATNGGPMVSHTLQGGGSFISSNNGVLFKVNPDGTGFQVLYVFGSQSDAHGDLLDGTHPMSGVIQGADGYLYGTTFDGASNSGFPQGAAGNAYGRGVVYKVAPDGTNFQVLHAFGSVTDQYGNALDGSNPVGGLIQGRDGALYGTAIAGGTNGTGVIFKINPDGTGFQVLHTFSALTGEFRMFNQDGANPIAALLQGKDGALYGTTINGGSTGYGVIFKINPDGTNFQVLHSFAGGEGAHNGTSLIQSKDGTLYGVNGGYPYDGQFVFYKLNPDGTGFQVLHGPGSGVYGALFDGVGSYAGVIQGHDGNFYGITVFGGNARFAYDGAGTLFRIGPQLLSVAPASVAAGSGDLQLTLVGTGFAQNDTLLWNGTTS
ncbi:MAG TPA: choice-of-anchor tandem repeat GloVer-containing protein, partial [Chthonomonas sp.]|uniref:choice-of-anchor tandem repeat GloVer-containing protein n=1 Tax=Chthonomonas sp. TaxID=2282153 RepID=UPI002B4ADB2C